MISLTNILIFQIIYKLLNNLKIQSVQYDYGNVEIFSDLSICLI